MGDKTLKEISEALDNTVTRVLGREDEGAYVLLPKETVEYVLELVDTQRAQIAEQAELIIEWQGIADRQREKLIAKDKQIADGREIVEDDLRYWKGELEDCLDNHGLDSTPTSSRYIQVCNEIIDGLDAWLKETG